jgi:hypothetical protein
MPAAVPIPGARPIAVDQPAAINSSVALAFWSLSAGLSP